MKCGTNVVFYMFLMTKHHVFFFPTLLIISLKKYVLQEGISHRSQVTGIHSL